MNYLKFDVKLFVCLTLCFIIMTVIGTITHEMGHYSVARILGYKAQFNYASCIYWDEEDEAYFREVGKKYPDEISNDQYFPGKEKFMNLLNKYKKDGLLITLGGPVQTTLTGTIGLLLLLFFRKRINKTGQLTIAVWTFIFLSLFWLRQLANLFMLTLNYFLKGGIGEKGDEVRIARYFGLNILTIQVATGLIAALVLLYIIRLIPKAQLLTFLSSGLIGGVAGYYLWIIKFGSVIMP